MQSSRITLLLLSALVSGAFAGPKQPKKPKKPAGPDPTHADIAYDVHERTKLDFWQAQGEGPRPVFVFFHGGGWIVGDKSKNGRQQAEALLAKGISVATINYRLAPQHPLPAPVRDAARAIQFLRHKADEWNIDKHRFVLGGGSAGGCTSLWLACHDDLADPDAQDPVARESTRVQGATVRGAQTAIDPKLIEPWIGPNVFHEMIYKCVGEESIEAALANYDRHQPLYHQFSAYYHLSADDPPILLGYNADISLPASDFDHGIHHGMFGVKLQEKSKQVGHDKVHLVIGKSKEAGPYASADDFVEQILLGE
jgi:acetyl esterase/lipase